MTCPLSQEVPVRWPQPGDPIVDLQSVPGYRRHLVPKFDDEKWSLGVLSGHPSASGCGVRWRRFPEPLRDQFRLAGWALLNLPLPDLVVFRGGPPMRSRVGVEECYHTICVWVRFATWLHDNRISRLAEVDGTLQADFCAAQIKERNLRRSSASTYLTALTRLHGYGNDLPEHARIGEPPWIREGVDDYLPPQTPRGENATEPIDPATMGPLLLWALRFAEEFSTDILAARDEERRLREVLDRMEDRPAQVSEAAGLQAYLDRLLATGQPIPSSPAKIGGRGFATTYMAAMTGTPLTAAYTLLNKPRLRRLRDANPGPAPLAVPMRGTAAGKPWRDYIEFHEAGRMIRFLNTACFIVVAYLTGMRPSEVLALEAGCCPAPEQQDDRTAVRRHLIYGRQFKTARDDDGRHISGGLPREVPWVAVPQAAAAIRVLEQIAGDTGLLFPPVLRPRPGRALTARAMGGRIEDFITFVNDLAAGSGESEAIPPDPAGRVGTMRFRRSLAWHIARRPGGLTALAVQYGHLRTAISEGYASRSKGGIHELLDVETARCAAEHLSDVHEAVQAGEGVSGPAARRLIHAAGLQHERFAGVITTPRQAKALLADPELTVFENADAYLTCNYEPTRALCNPLSGNGSRARPTAPSLDRCRPACPNIARTDTHAQQLRQEASRLRGQAGAPLTPEPIADRLRNRADELDKLAGTHDRTRILNTGEDEHGLSQ